ncbi:MAG: alpha/beta fold hydrolase [Chryseolinea sp.]
MKPINLFCFPFAGGTKYSYNALLPYVPSFIKFVPIELPGRGTRLGEPLLSDIHLIADDVYSQVKSKLIRPYAFYGHSMGTLIGYLLTKRIIQDGFDHPIHLFFTGCAGPSEIESQPKSYHLPKNQFISKLKKMGGSPPEVLDDEEFMDMYEPILRADFQAAETFCYVKSDPFHIPIWVAIGKDEDATMQQAESWRKETTANVEVFEFPGDHFFILEHQQRLLNMISNGLEKVAV